MFPLNHKFMKSITLLLFFPRTFSKIMLICSVYCSKFALNILNVNTVCWAPVHLLFQSGIKVPMCGCWCSVQIQEKKSGYPKRSQIGSLASDFPGTLSREEYVLWLTPVHLATCRLSWRKNIYIKHLQKKSSGYNSLSWVHSSLKTHSAVCFFPLLLFCYPLNVVSLAFKEQQKLNCSKQESRHK